MPEAEHRRLPGVKALTVHQPWAWSVIYGGKDVENRRWKTSYLPRASGIVDAARRAGRKPGRHPASSGAPQAGRRPSRAAPG